MWHSLFEVATLASTFMISDHTFELEQMCDLNFIY